MEIAMVLESWGHQVGMVLVSLLPTPASQRCGSARQLLHWTVMCCAVLCCAGSQ